MTQSLNPNHPVSQELDDQWYKIVALFMRQLGLNEILLTSETIQAAANSTEGLFLAVRDEPEGLHIFLVTEEQAHTLARKAGGLLV